MRLDHLLSREQAKEETQRLTQGRSGGTSEERKHFLSKWNLKGCKSSKKAWEREHEHGRRESCKLIVDCVLSSVSFSRLGKSIEIVGV